MARVLVVYGSRHGGTQGIAERIGEVLQSRNLDATVVAARSVVASQVATADAFVVGSGVYMGSWLDEPLEFMKRNTDALAAKPLWLFSSGPLPGSSKDKQADDPIENALGPADGPGSGGRKKIEALSAATGPRDHRVFMGRYDPDDSAKNLPERFMKSFMRVIPAIRDVLPAGDYRDWAAIEAWADGIATELRPASEPVAMA
jgi:menaquinone-dependent protoporphyrinogen oxidase